MDDWQDVKCFGEKRDSYELAGDNGIQTDSKTVLNAYNPQNILNTDDKMEVIQITVWFLKLHQFIQGESSNT